MVDYLDEVWNSTVRYRFGPEPARPDPGGGSVVTDAEQQENSPAEVTAIVAILCLFCVVGTLGNGLVLYVFARTTSKLTSTIFVLALAGTDLITCVLIIPFTVTAIHVHYILAYDVACKVFQFLITCNVPLSAFIMVAIAVDRYICICHPFVHIMTVRRAKIVVGVLASFASTLGLITALGYGVYNVSYVNDTAHNDSHVTTVVFANATGGREENDTRAYIGPIYPNIDELNTVESVRTKLVIKYSGLCQMSPTLFSANFINVYQKVYSSFYLISLLIVLCLYAMIYSSVTKQRARRRRQKLGKRSGGSGSGAVHQVNSQCQTEATETSVLPLNNLMHAPPSPRNVKLTVQIDGGNVLTKVTSTVTEDHENGLGVPEGEPLNVNSTPSKRACQAELAKARKENNNMLANIKTASMLFIVTVVFIIAFLPAWLMALQLVNFNIVIFYMYFAYNVGNPVIYAFMNQMFRENLCRLFTSFRGCCHR